MHNTASPPAAISPVGLLPAAGFTPGASVSGAFLSDGDGACSHERIVAAPSNECQSADVGAVKKRRPAKSLTLADLAPLVAYDPETGHVTSKRTGKRIGHCNDKHIQYLSIQLLNARIPVHQLAFLLMLGRWPEGVVDHINRNRTDNRWANLRECTQSQNCVNKVPAHPSASGLRGVMRGNGKWSASLRYQGQLHRFGWFHNMTDAVEAYVRNAPAVLGDFFDPETIRPHLEHLKAAGRVEASA